MSCLRRPSLPHPPEPMQRASVQRASPLAERDSFQPSRGARPNRPGVPPCTCPPCSCEQPSASLASQADSSPMGLGWGFPFHTHRCFEVLLKVQKSDSRGSHQSWHFGEACGPGKARVPGTEKKLRRGRL